MPAATTTRRRRPSSSPSRSTWRASRCRPGASSPCANSPPGTTASGWRRSTGGALQAGDFVEALEPFPEALVPKRRKQRAYLSSILAKNEVNREGPYNRKLFYRIRRGHYILNPQLRIRVGGEWQGIYELLDLERIGYPHVEERNAFYNLNEAIEFRLTRFRKQIRELAAGQGPDAAQ